MEKGPVFGLSIGELLTIYDRDSRSWKMSECLFTGDYAKYSEALPKSGIMRNGRIYAQATWARRTGGKESGLWPTPNTMEGIVPKTLERIVEYNQKARPGRNYLAMNLREQVVYGARNLDGTPQYPQFPTPHSNCHTGSGRRGDGGENLQTAVMNFPTPRANKPEGYSSNGFRPTLAQIVTGEDKPLHGQLNPTWVDWLMGYPIGWTDLGDSETRLSLK